MENIEPDLYKELFSQALDGVVVANAHGIIVDVNNSVLEMFGYEKEALLGQNVNVFLPVDGRAQHDQYFTAGESKYISNLSGRALNGEVVDSAGRPFFVQVSVSYSEHHGHGYFCAVVRDIAKLVENQREKKKEQDRVARYFEYPQLMVVLSKNGDIQSINDNAVTLLGEDKASLLGENFVQMFLPFKERARFLEVIERYFQNGESASTKEEFALILGNGQIRSVVLAMYIEEKGRNHDAQVLCIGEDVTELRRKERETSVIEQQLQQSQKMEMIGRLTGGVAHDFNNSLASILGYCSLASESVSQAKFENLPRYLQQINVAGEKAKDLIQKMLTFSRGVSIRRELLDLDAQVEKVLLLMKSVIPASVEIEKVVLHDGLLAEIDESGFHQVLTNLIMNAVDATNGSGHITISLDRVVKTGAICSSCHGQVNGAFAKLTVVDDGVGIDSKVLPKLFDPFFTTKKDGQAAGMGMSVVHGLVHGYGGHIQVNTAADKGASVTILLPCRADMSKEMDKKETPPFVVVVDDDYISCQFMERLLLEEGYEVAVFTSAKKAERYLNSARRDIHALFLDQMMPDMTGTQLARKLAQGGHHYNTVIFTAFEEQIDVYDLEEAGIELLLMKPLNRDKIVSVLSKIPRIKTAG
jgi:PAS domain S-box-containing protein